MHFTEKIFTKFGFKKLKEENNFYTLILENPKNENIYLHLKFYEDDNVFLILPHNEDKILPLNKIDRPRFLNIDFTNDHEMVIDLDHDFNLYNKPGFKETIRRCKIDMLLNEK